MGAVPLRGDDPRTTPTTLDHGGRTIRGWQWEPQDGTAADAPVVLLVHGFSSTALGGQQLFVQTARHLVARGAVVRSHDRLGQGVSDGEFADITIRDEVDQVVAMIDAADRGQGVHVVAHSLGAVESALAAAREPSRVRTLTLWSPAGVVVDDITEHDAIQGQPLAPVRERGWFDFGGMPLGQAFVADVQDGLDVYGPVSGYTGPADVVHGTEDAIVPVSYGRRYAELLPGARLTVVDGADHGWSSVPFRERLLALLDERLGLS
ncbi:alpha/beta fold hydrolase [Curtobacterium caseinilyticum]|uniref:Alpha/beta fold hydrolase n=1 Tax=Curtobacterium caseinilyticum TaxID=3055137 RepID=A0ABT7TRT7_9MICO|nr:alpha/beta fold hydrolase [Curtobacterium caseinilyticum]MDM7892308.1 alpha/beta fold hydrolase [Curtobacterium caseinilyticum]